MKELFRPRDLWRLPFLFVAMIVNGAEIRAEQVDVKYRGPVRLDTFKCQDISRSSFIKRVCYDAVQSYMVINLSGTFYHYCQIDQNTVSNLLGAPAMGKFFNQEIKGSGSVGPFDCRTHRVPQY